MKLSFGIVTHNNGAQVKKTVESLIAAAGNKYEYIVYIVDNNSTDDTVRILSDIKGNLKIFDTKKNPGFGAGHNKIIKFLDSDFHFVVNPDIIVDSSEQLIKMIEYMQNNEEVGLLVPLIKGFDGEIQYLNKLNPTVFDMLIRFISPNIFKKRQEKYETRNIGYDNIHRVEYASGCFMMFRTEIFKKIKGFDESFFMYLEDADITRRVNQVSRAIFYPYSYVLHAWAREGHRKFKYMWITLQSMFIYFKKWGW